jgi:DNA-directed RNA polymerase specialized sigma24 family protein
MRQDAIETTVLKGGEPPVAQQGLPPVGSSPIYSESSATGRTLNVSALVEQCQQEIAAYRRGEPSNEAYGLELLRRATVQGDHDAWRGIEQCFGELVRSWLHAHPRRGMACHLEREETYVALAFERFWQATRQQRISFRTLGGALAYLRASLHGAILDTLRTYARPREVSLPEPGEAGELRVEDQLGRNQVWEVLQSMLPNAREQRLAYLLYHCGLKPREIVRFCPQEWQDVQEIYRLRRSILERLLRNANQLRWRLIH